MKKFFTLIAAAMMSVASFAQDGILPDTLYTAPFSGYALSDTTVIGKFIEYADSVVLDGFDGAKGHIKAEWDDSGWTKINGEAQPYVYFSDAVYYCGSFLPKYISGRWNRTDGGTIYFGAYLYDNAGQYQTGNWGYLYFRLMTEAQKDAYVLGCRVEAMKPLAVTTAQPVYTMDCTTGETNTVTGYLNDGWMMMGDATATPTSIAKKSTINPVDDTTLAKAETKNGITVKAGNMKKVVYMKVKQIKEAKFYFTSDKAGERFASVSYGEINATSYKAIKSDAIAANVGVTIDCTDLDPAKEYLFVVGGNQVSDGEGADVDFFAAKFIYGQPTAISTVEANAEAATKSGKFIKNGQLVIVKNGRQYNATGALMK